MNYTGGSPCGAAFDRRSPFEKRKIIDDDDDDEDEDEKPRKPKSNAGRKSTIITMLCDKDSYDTKPKVSMSFTGTTDECTYTFIARSQAACGGVSTDQQAVGPGGVFGIM